MGFIHLQDKVFVLTGVSNRKSVATFIGQTLIELGAKLILTVQTEEHEKRAKKLFPESDCFIVDVESEDQVERFGEKVSESGQKIDGLIHSIAFANYSQGIKPFHETKWQDYAQASQISCFSLVSLTQALKSSLKESASIVALSISNTRVTTYGYMGPIKASLDAAVAYLAKSLSKDSKIRVNALCSGPLKTSASAGIPGYIDNYLYAEKLTLRKQALKTQEVADTAVYLLSDRSSGINATQVIVDAGMSANYFDEEVVSS